MKLQRNDSGKEWKKDSQTQLKHDKRFTNTKDKKFYVLVRDQTFCRVKLGVQSGFNDDILGIILFRCFCVLLLLLSLLVFCSDFWCTLFEICKWPHRKKEAPFSRLMARKCVFPIKHN